MRRTIRLSTLALLLGAAACAPRPAIRAPSFLPPILGGGAAIAGQPIPSPGVQPVPPLPVLRADFAAKAGSTTVRFGKGSFTLDAKARAILDRQALWLLTNPTVRASIEGHADVRQTREHALALGERRAAAVRNFLLTQGVRPEQLTVVSWGKERPATAGVHDAAFLQNARVETVILAPDPALLPPPPPPLPVR